MKLWLVRHAAPCAEPDRCRGRTDFEADAQATARAALALAQLLPQGTVLHCSPLGRCLQLARQLQALRGDLPLRMDPRLAEMDFGDWEDRRWDEIGEAAVHDWTRDFAQHRPGGGESVAAFMARVAQAWDEQQAGGADAAWITHAGVIRAAQLLARGVRCPRHADEWPAAAVPYGQAVLIER